MRKNRELTLYLPRSTVSISTILAIESIARDRGLSFGRALQAALEDSPVFRQAVREVEGDVSGKTSDMIRRGE